MAINAVDLEAYFHSYRMALIKDLQQAKSYFGLWRNLTNAASGKYQKEMNNMKGFFSTTMQANVEASLACLARVIDTHKDSLSIYKFLNFIEMNQQIFSAKSYADRMRGRQFYEEMVNRYATPETRHIEAQKNKLAPFEEAIKNIQTWRDGMLAHRDRAWVLEGKDGYAAHPVMTDQIESLINTLGEIVNYFSGLYDSNFYVLEIEPSHDWETVLHAIGVYLQNRYGGE